MSYGAPRANEWVQPIRKGYKLACCDCGLVHDVDFRIYKGRIQFRVRRNGKATGGMRAANGIKIAKFNSRKERDRWLKKSKEKA